MRSVVRLSVSIVSSILLPSLWNLPIRFSHLSFFQNLLLTSSKDQEWNGVVPTSITLFDSNKLGSTAFDLWMDLTLDWIIYAIFEVIDKELGGSSKKVWVSMPYVTQTVLSGRERGRRLAGREGHSIRALHWKKHESEDADQMMSVNDQGRFLQSSPLLMKFIIEMGISSSRASWDANELVAHRFRTEIQRDGYIKYLKSIGGDSFGSIERMTIEVNGQQLVKYEPTEPPVSTVAPTTRPTFKPSVTRTTRPTFKSTLSPTTRPTAKPSNEPTKTSDGNDAADASHFRFFVVVATIFLIECGHAIFP